MLFLAIALWPLGEIERAVSLVGNAQVRIEGLTHVQTRALGRVLAAMFDLIRGDLSQLASN